VKSAFLLLFGAVWLVVGLGFLAGGVATYRLEERYRAEGELTEAVVLTKSMDRARRGSGGRRSTSYHVTYRFTTPDGRTVEGRDSVGAATWDALEERGPVRVRYLRGSPGTSRLEGGDPWWVPLLFAGIGLVLAPVGGVIFASGWRQWRTHRRLRTGGVRTEGTVTAVRETRFSVNRVRQWRIHYRYRDQAGRAHAARSGYLPPEQVEDWQEGDVGVVRFDPDRPEVSVWVGREAPDRPDLPPGPVAAPVEPR
jgi:hypothetical protein